MEVSTTVLSALFGLGLSTVGAIVVESNSHTSPTSLYSNASRRPSERDSGWMTHARAFHRPRERLMAPTYLLYVQMKVLQIIITERVRYSR